MEGKEQSIASTSSSKTKARYVNTKFSPNAMLKRGWNGVTSPLHTVKESIFHAANQTPRNGINSSKNHLSTPTNSTSLHPIGSNHTPRVSTPNSSIYPNLFDINSPQDPTSQSTSRRNSRRPSLGQKSSWASDDLSVATLESYAWTEEERAYQEVQHHNLHSVLMNPKASNWTGALLDVLYQHPLDVEIPLPAISIPGMESISTKDFQSYMQKHGQEAKKYDENHRKPIEEQLSSSHVPSISVADEDVAQCFNVVPSLFFKSSYDFSNPNVFQEVSDMGINGMSVQDTLTSYLDRVEFTLLRQVSSRSDRFYEASANQEVMKRAITGACDHVSLLRKTMDRLRNGLADKTLDIVALHRRQKRIAELHEVVTMIESVKNAESAVDALVQCQEYANALDLIESSQLTLNDYLKGIHGLSTLNEKFQSYRSFIQTQISQRYLAIVTSLEPIVLEEPDEMEGEFTTLTHVLFRLDALADVVIKYRDRLNEEIKVVVKTVVTETIAVSTASMNARKLNTSIKENGDNNGTPSPTAISTSPSDSKISIQLRALSSNEFLQCIQLIFEHLLTTLQRAVTVKTHLVSLMDKKMEIELKLDAEHEANLQKQQNKDSQSVWTPTDSIGGTSGISQQGLGDWKKKNQCQQVVKAIDDVLRKTCEFSQRSVSNLFAVRKEVQATYTMAQLRQLYDTTMDFVIGVEKLTGKMDYTLRGALFSQLKLFLEKYHQTQMAKLVSTLDHELWKQTEISVPRHKSLLDLATGKGVPLILSEDREVQYSDATAPPHKAIVIGDTKFKVVWSVLLMLEIVMNYISCAANFPVLATDVLQRSIEIFRLFNSRTTQLILGAGAMQVARLKSISARHLALASQSLEISMLLIPHIKAALSTHFSDRQKLLLDEFNRVVRDYAEHNEKIFGKFTSIVEDQIMKRYLENVCTDVDYDKLSPSDIPTPAMQGITQSTLKLHAVLMPVLSPTHMRDVMSRVLDMFTRKLPECFKDVKPETDEGKKRVLDDISAFVQAFHNVETIDFDGAVLRGKFETTYKV